MSDELRPDNRPLKLFVIGPSSGDPSEWPDTGRKILVFAHDEEEASRWNEFGEPINEVSPSEPVMIFHDHYVGNEE